MNFLSIQSNVIGFEVKVPTMFYVAAHQPVLGVYRLSSETDVAWCEVKKEPIFCSYWKHPQWIVLVSLIFQVNIFLMYE